MLSDKTSQDDHCELEQKEDIGTKHEGLELSRYTVIPLFQRPSFPSQQFRLGAPTRTRRKESYLKNLEKQCENRRYTKKLRRTQNESKTSSTEEDLLLQDAIEAQIEIPDTIDHAKSDTDNYPSADSEDELEFQNEVFDIASDSGYATVAIVQTSVIWNHLTRSGHVSVKHIKSSECIRVFRLENDLFSVGDGVHRSLHLVSFQDGCDKIKKWIEIHPPTFSLAFDSEHELEHQRLKSLLSMFYQNIILNTLDLQASILNQDYWFIVGC